MTQIAASVRQTTFQSSMGAHEFLLKRQLNSVHCTAISKYEDRMINLGQARFTDCKQLA